MSLHLKVPLNHFVFPASLPQLWSDDNRVREDDSSMKPPPDPANNVYDAWLASRVVSASSSHQRGPEVYLVPGAQRRLTFANLRLAQKIVKECTPEFMRLFWSSHPVRTAFLLSLNIARGVFPALRGYSQALIINELQSSISSGNFTWSHLLHIFGTEISRMILESTVDTLASNSENTVHGSARFQVEYKQMELRLRLDAPTLADPLVRDLLHESDLFVRSFAQAGIGGFGLISPLDFVRVLTLISELVSHVFVLFSLTRGNPSHLCVLALSLLVSVLPHIFARISKPSRVHFGDFYNPNQVRTAERQEKMRNLAHSESHRPEIMVFGLAPWVLQCWASARKTMLGLEQSEFMKESDISSSLVAQLNFNFTDLMAVLQNIPLVFMLQTTSGSLGSLALYRNSVQALVFTVRQLLSTVRMALQSIFLMGAFCAAMEIEPRLSPKEDEMVEYRSLPSGMKIEARNLSYTYPGSSQPSLRNVNFIFQPGERLAIVGHNGSGKSTLAKILLRVLDFDSGELLVNGVDIRRYSPAEYHRHISTVFQGFSKFDSTVIENVGVGYVPHLEHRPSVVKAIQTAGASRIVQSLPKGLSTRLDAAGADPYACVPTQWGSNETAHGLSGGEWQHIALSRAFMRANQPEIDLLLFDEPASSLDPHAQNRTFDAIGRASRGASGQRTKSVIFITHRLSTVKHADKVALVQNGTISEFGTHEELMQREGAYASLYRASV